MKKILITTQSLGMGGVETALLALLKALSKYDISIDLFVLEQGILSKEFNNLTKVNIIPVKIPKNKIFYRINKNLFHKHLIKKYNRLLNQNYDIAIAFYGINNYCDLYAAASHAKTKYIWVHNNFATITNLSKHKFIYKIRNLIIKKKFKYFDYIIPVSESAKQGFINTFHKYQEKLVVVNNIIDLTRLEGRYEKISLKGTNKMIYVGRLDSAKCVDNLIKEASLVINSLEDTYLYIVGDGPQKEALNQLVESLNLSSHVIFLGNQNNPFKYMEQADLILSASKNEAYSINTLEALAMHKYFISADNEGAQDIFYNTNKADLNNGIVCKSQHIHDYALNYFKNKSTFHPNFDIKKANINIEKEIVKLFNIK